MLRGQRSREAIARKLKVDKSTVYKWEKGVTKPSWRHLLSYIEINNLEDVKVIPKKWLNFDLSSSKTILSFLVQKYSKSEISEICGISQKSVSLTLQNSVSIKVDILFRLWHHYDQLSFFLFIEQSIGLKNCKSTQSIGVNWEFETQMSRLYPFFAGAIYLIQSGLKVDEAINSFSKYFFIDKALARSFLDSLLEHGYVTTEAGRLKLCSNHWFDSRANFQLNRDLNHYWTINSLRHFQNSEKFLTNTFFNYKIMALSDEGLNQVKEEYLHFFSKVKRISENDKSIKKDFVSLSLQLMDFNEVESHSNADNVPGVFS